ncbi:hypothetical protein CEXT_347621 [Caerostris extrusa]|uniref:Uncharacterized protein n=1 Tax=Caerostris extrusa TaxID=172846 RepID=A0AAV4S919_CAEEX|nr:hypothetical protein CEXT_347621 [Caerostris extrusa]
MIDGHHSLDKKVIVFGTDNGFFTSALWTLSRQESNQKTVDERRAKLRRLNPVGTQLISHQILHVDGNFPFCPEGRRFLENSTPTPPPLFRRTALPGNLSWAKLFFLSIFEKSLPIPGVEEDLLGGEVCLLESGSSSKLVHLGDGKRSMGDVLWRTFLGKISTGSHFNTALKGCNEIKLPKSKKK